MRGLLIAAVAHAGLIGLACLAVAASHGNATPRLSSIQTASITHAAQTPETSEAQSVSYPRSRPAPVTPPASTPLRYDASDVLPKPKPRPKLVAPEPLAPPPSVRIPKPHVTDELPHHITVTEPEKETVEETTRVDNPTPVKEVADQPTQAAPGRQDAPPRVQHPPRVLKWNAPADVRRGFKGRVLAVIQLDEHGRLTGIKLDPGTGNDEWDRQLRNAFRRATYKPATVEGKPVASELRQPVDFE